MAILTNRLGWAQSGSTVPASTLMQQYNHAHPVPFYRFSSIKRSMYGPIYQCRWACIWRLLTFIFDQSLNYSFVAADYFHELVTRFCWYRNRFQQCRNIANSHTLAYAFISNYPSTHSNKADIPFIIKFKADKVLPND